MTTSSNFAHWLGIPPAFHEMINVKAPELIREKCIEWMSSTQPFCLLSGSNGTGKTTIACKMLVSWHREYQSKDVSACFIKASDLYHSWLDENRSGSVKGLLDRYCEYDLLVLDDFGVRMPTEGWKEWLICLIDYRMDWMKKTILTTNLDSKGIKEFYGETMMSRLSVGIAIKFDGKDRRIAK